MTTPRTRIAEIVSNSRQPLLEGWLANLREALGDVRIANAELTQQATELLGLIASALQTGTDTQNDGWTATRQLLDEVSRSRALQGFSPTETAMFVFSLKKPLFEELRRAFADDAQTLADAMWEANLVVDALGLHTVQMFQRSREAIILRQQEELLELSTPVVTLWDGILALPMIGTLDSARTQVVMESLLQRIVDTGSEVAIIDITGVPTVDTLVAQHLLKTVTAIRLMGADCIISGIRPQIAQTIVHLGVDLRGVITKASLADALAVAFDRSGLTVVKRHAS
jgi:rsbT co-antagonist protein RsbR